jgi:Family of unknown function (DUF6325)
MSLVRSREEPGMPDAQGPDTERELGPIDFVAVEFPDGRITASGFEMLLDLADRGVIEILDVEFIAKDRDGSVATVPVRELPVSEEVDLAVWDGASSGLLDEGDVTEVASALQPGGVAVAVVFENRWVIGVIDAWRRDGARLIADGGLPVEDVVAALDATERD